MAKRKSKKTATKKASKLRAKKAAKARAPRAAAAKTARGARVAADSVFAFVKRPDDPTTLPARGLAILNAIEKLGSGTAEQVAKRVVKSDYDGKQELVYLSGFFLRKMLNLGLVSVERSA